MAQPPVNPTAHRRTPSQIEDDRLELVMHFRDQLMARHGLNETEATDVGQTCVAALSTLEPNEIAAAISRFRQEARRRRDAAICAELRRGNVAEVARQHGVSRTHAYRVYQKRRRSAVP